MRDLFPAGATMPVWPVTEDGRCGCGYGGCRRPGKHADERAPNTPGGPYAVITGERSGIVVIDIDRKPGAADGLSQYDEMMSGASTPDTLTVDTPAEGLHIYCKHPGFHVGNGKLSSAIDVRGDEANEGGFAYVVGPGSPGYVKTDDPCVVLPAEPYSVAPGDTHEISALPERLMGLLLMRGTRKKQGFAPTPIDVDTPEGERRIAMGQGACESMPASQADGEGGIRLLNVCLRLVRALELPVEVAGALVVEYFNPRCTHTDGVTPYPWSDDDIWHKLEDARDKSDIPCGVASVGIAEVIREHARPAVMRGLSERIQREQSTRKVHKPGHTYEYKIGNLSTDPKANKIAYNELISLFTVADEWEGCWQYNRFSRQLACVDPPLRLDAEETGLSERDLACLRSYLEHRGILAIDKEVRAAVISASSNIEFHPVHEYLCSLSGGNPEIFKDLAAKLFGASNAMADAFLEKTLVGAVRRILSPGCQVDSVLVLHGPMQGEGKTSFVAAMFGDEWTRRGLPADLGNRDAAHALQGFWAVELGELTHQLKNPNAAIKAFLSERIDHYREFGNGNHVVNKRQCVFVGTTNDDDFLRDATGNRRYWPISIPPGHEVPLEWVRENRDALWAAALVLADRAEYRHWFTREEESQVSKTRERFVERDGWHSKVEEYCRGRQLVRSEDVFLAIGGELKDFDRGKMLRVTDTLKRLGCKSVVKDKTKQWTVPEEIAAGKPSAEEILRRRVEDAARKRTEAN